VLRETRCLASRFPQRCSGIGGIYENGSLYGSSIDGDNHHRQQKYRDIFPGYVTHIIGVWFFYGFFTTSIHDLDEIPTLSANESRVFWIRSTADVRPGHDIKRPMRVLGIGISSGQGYVTLKGPTDQEGLARRIGAHPWTSH